MELVDFQKDLQECDGITLLNDYILFSDYELYDETTGDSVYFDKFEDVLDYKLNGESIRDIIKDKENNYEMYDGGRGQEYSIRNKGQTLFGGKGSRSRGKVEKVNPLPTAYINTLTSPRFKSIDKTAKAFGKNLMDADREYGGVIDDNGFAVDYVKGEKTSVGIPARKGMTSIHNHPVKALQSKSKNTIYFNAPSPTDLRSWATGKSKGSIVTSSGNKLEYRLTKNHHFDSSGFIKAMNKAKSTGQKNYDSDVDKFLKANQKKYGYTYKTYKIR